MDEVASRRDICERTFAFAVRIVKLCRFLNKRPDIARALVKQLVRSGTFIGANVEEAQAGQSIPDFISKYAIALKEAREARYWLRLMVATECLSELRVAALINEADELTHILAAIIISTKKRHKA